MWSYYCIKKSPKSTKFTTEAENPNSSSLQQGSALNIINNAMLMARWAERVAGGLAVAVRVPWQKPARVLALLPPCPSRCLAVAAFVREENILPSAHQKPPRAKASEGAGRSAGLVLPSPLWLERVPGEGEQTDAPATSAAGCQRSGVGFLQSVFPLICFLVWVFIFCFSYHVQQENRNP